MKMARMLATVFFCMCILPVAFGAVLQGTVYTLDLTTATEALVELRPLNGGVTQKFVANEGTYTFTAPLGRYLLSATKKHESAAEYLTITEDGTYLVDIILTLSLDDLDALLNETAENPADDTTQESTVRFLSYVLTGLAFLGTVVGLLYLIRRRKQKKTIPSDRPSTSSHVSQETTGPTAIGTDEETDELPRRVLEFLKAEGGRTTQKHVRKAFPLSEAKISLVLTELEHRGSVRKIKKGRGNVIVLQNTP